MFSGGSLFKGIRASIENEKLAAIIDIIPLAVIGGLTGFSISSMVLLLLDAFYAWLVWGFGLATAMTVAFVVVKYATAVKRPGSTSTRVVCDIAVLIAITLWGGYNIQYTSQHILTNRDPATYANAAAWLSQYNSLKIKTSSTLDGIEGVRQSSAGFAEIIDKGEVHAQGQHLLPALLGAMGKVVGPKHILRLNVVFGATALLAMYCFGRLFMRPYWAAVATGVMAASMPLLYFSRDVYTEPLTMTFTFAGLAFLWLAQKNKNLLLWLVAGLTSAAGVLVRIDAYLSLLGMAGFLVVYLILADTKEFRFRFKQVAMFVMPVAFVSVLAQFDLSMLSEEYYRSTQRLRLLEIIALVIILLGGLLAVYVIKKYPKLLVNIDKRTRGWRQPAAFILVVSMGIVLMSRPLWMQDMNFEQPYYRAIAGIQQTEGFPAEPRTYAEMTTQWMDWYIGPTMTALGLVGLGVAAYKSMEERNVELVCGLAVILGTALLYFVKPNITPDQIWASRRFLPVVMPGLALFGGYALSQFASHVQIPSVKAKYIIMGLVGVGLLLDPLVTASPMLRQRDTTQFALIVNVCEALPDNATMIWLGMARLQAVQPTLTFCGEEEAYGYILDENDKPSSKKLAEIAKTVRSHGKTPIVGVYNKQLGEYIEKEEQQNLTVVHDSSYIELMPALIAPPNRYRLVNYGVSLAVIKNDGSLSELPSISSTTTGLDQ